MSTKLEEYILKRCTDLELKLVNGGTHTSSTLRSDSINHKSIVKNEQNSIFDDNIFWEGKILSTKFL